MQKEDHWIIGHHLAVQYAKTDSKILQLALLKELHDDLDVMSAAVTQKGEARGKMVGAQMFRPKCVHPQSSFGFFECARFSRPRVCRQQLQALRYGSDRLRIHPALVSS